MINIFQSYKTLEEINQTGIQGILVTSSNAVPMFPAFILGALFIILTIGSYFATERKIGRGDLFGSMAVAGFVCVIVSFLFSLIPNFQNVYILVSMVIIELILVLVIYLSPRE